MIKCFTCIVTAVVFAVVFPTCDKEEPDLRTNKDAEVHMVGVYQAREWGLTNSQVEDWEKLAASLRNEKGDGARVAMMMSTKGLAAARSPKLLGPDTSGPTSAIRRDLLNSLRDVAAGPRVYNVPSFTKSKQAKHVESLLQQRTELSYVQTMTLNRAYLAFASGGGIKEVTEHYHSVTVKVAAGRDVILVLSSSEACRWKVVLEKGARVSGCILFGYYTQEVDPDTIPAIYRMHHDAKGEATNKNGWHAYKETGEHMFKIEQMVAELTGHKLTSFQGQYEAPKEGFVVKPSSK